MSAKPLTEEEEGRLRQAHVVGDELTPRLLATLDRERARAEKAEAALAAITAERDIFREQHLATVADLKPLMDYAESVAPVETWGENVCAWAVSSLAAAVAERDAWREYDSRRTKRSQGGISLASVRSALDKARRLRAEAEGR